jgi:large subunit ribosomal protein L21
MFAVLKTGGKQYRVQQGDVLRVEKLQAEAGDTIQFNEVLVVGDQIGAPFVAGAAVQATVIDQIKGEKVIHFVRRRRKHSSKRTKGHRQQLTLVRVTEILAAGGEGTGIKAAVGSGSKASFAGMAPVAATEPGAQPKARRGKAAAALAGAALGAAALAAGAALATSALAGGDQDKE